MGPFVPQKLSLQSIAWEPLIPLMGQANRALAQYEGFLCNLRNPEILLSPMTTQEAVLSSRIEGTQATLGEVLKFEAGEEPEQESKILDIQEIINYRAALYFAERELKSRPFNLNLLLTLHEILLNSVRGVNKARGHYRKIQNWIGPANSSIEAAYYVPPEPCLLPEFLDDWEKYYHADQPDALVQLAIVHAQFEILHPFLDGNGRLGRLIIPIFLAEKKLLSRPVFYLSAYLEKNRDLYIENLRRLGRTEDAWNDWIKFFLTALAEQSAENTKKARAVVELYERSKAQVLNLTHSQFAIPLLDKLFEQPFFQPSRLENIQGSPSKQVISILLRRLKEAGIVEIVREGKGRRGQILVFRELLILCEGRDVFYLK